MDTAAVTSTEEDPPDAYLDELDDAAEAPVEEGAPAPTQTTDDALLDDLVRRVVYQDEVAFAAIYRALSSRVFAQALRITRDAGSAEEVVEDVFWQVWRQAPRFDPARGCAVAWVRRIARSRALDALRAMGRNPLHMAVDVDAEGAQQAGGSEDDPQRRMAEAQSAAVVDKAMAALDPLRRQLVALAFQRGYSQTEIAEQTGLPLGTVKSHIRRALALMKSSIEAAEGPQLSAQR